MIMSVYIPGLEKPAASGKGFFFNRLAGVLRKDPGLKIVSSLDEEADVSFNNHSLQHLKSKKRIIRFDGVWHDTAKPWQKRNASMSNAMNQCDGVVYQSQFAKAMCDKYLGTYDGPTRVIFNGVDLDFYTRAPRPEIEGNPSRVFVAFSKWRPHKRLKDIIESFLLAKINNSNLLVAGDLSRCGLSTKEQKKYFNHPQVRYLGFLTQEQMASYLAVATASIHLCWTDACPNSVVEAIAAKVPVICNNVGGTQELVRAAGGYICEIDEPYDMEPVDLYKPPSIDRRIVADAMWRSTIDREVVKNRRHIDITEVANQYYNFAKEVWNG